MNKLSEGIENIKDRWIKFLMQDTAVEHIIKFAKK